MMRRLKTFHHRTSPARLTAFARSTSSVAAPPAATAPSSAALLHVPFRFRCPAIDRLQWVSDDKAHCGTCDRTVHRMSDLASLPEYAGQCVMIGEELSNAAKDMEGTVGACPSVSVAVVAPTKAAAIRAVESIALEVGNSSTDNCSHDKTSMLSKLQSKLLSKVQPKRQELPWTRLPADETLARHRRGTALEGTAAFFVQTWHGVSLVRFVPVACDEDEAKPIDPFLSDERRDNDTFKAMEKRFASVVVRSFERVIVFDSQSFVAPKPATLQHALFGPAFETAWSTGQVELFTSPPTQGDLHRVISAVHNDYCRKSIPLIGILMSPEVSLSLFFASGEPHDKSCQQNQQQSGQGVSSVPLTPKYSNGVSFTSAFLTTAHDNQTTLDFVVQMVRKEKQRERVAGDLDSEPQSPVRVRCRVRDILPRPAGAVRVTVSSWAKDTRDPSVRLKVSVADASVTDHSLGDVSVFATRLSRHGMSREISPETYVALPGVEVNLLEHGELHTGASFDPEAEQEILFEMNGWDLSYVPGS